MSERAAELRPTHAPEIDRFASLNSISFVILTMVPRVFAFSEGLRAGCFYLLGSGAWASSGPGAGEKGLESGHGEVDIMKVIEISSPVLRA